MLMDLEWRGTKCKLFMGIKHFIVCCAFINTIYIYKPKTGMVYSHHYASINGSLISKINCTTISSLLLRSIKLFVHGFIDVPKVQKVQDCQERAHWGLAGSSPATSHLSLEKGTHGSQAQPPPPYFPFPIISSLSPVTVTIYTATVIVECGLIFS